MQIFGMIVLSNFIVKLAYVKGVDYQRGCSEREISTAEKELNLKFPDEYREYLRVFRQVTFGKNTWTGLSNQKNTNVVQLTKRERVNKWYPDNAFVLECKPNGEKILVNDKGIIYSFYRNELIHLTDNLTEYLNLCIKQL